MPSVDLALAKVKSQVISRTRGLGEVWVFFAADSAFPRLHPVLNIKEV